MSDMIRVGMADYKLCSSPDRITTLGLGSCMGVVICDPRLGLCGMAHVMLPDSKKLKKNEERKKFADTCLHDMYEELLNKGASRAHMYAKIAGGARMFSFDSENEMLNIGAQNVAAVRLFMQNHRIPIKGENVGDNYGRTIIFSPEDGLLHITAIGKGEYVI